MDLVEYLLTLCKPCLLMCLRLRNVLEQHFDLAAEHRQKLRLEPRVAFWPAIVPPGRVWQREDAGTALSLQISAPAEHGRLQAASCLSAEVPILRVGSHGKHEFELW